MSGLPLVMQGMWYAIYNGQTNDEFRYRWNNYKDNNRKSLRGEDHRQAGFFAHLQIAGHSGFINDTETRFIDKADPSDPTRREDFWRDTLETHYPQGLNILTHTISYLLSFFYLRVIFICYASFG